MKVKILIARADIVDSFGRMFPHELLKTQTGKTIKFAIGEGLLEYDDGKRELYVVEVLGLGEEITTIDEWHIEMGKRSITENSSITIPDTLKK